MFAQDKGGMQLDAAQVSVVPQHKSQWSLAAAALDLDREEETLALKQVWHACAAP